MDSLYEFYITYSSWIDTLACLAVFWGVAEIAFRQRDSEFPDPGPLVWGMGLLLTIALIGWDSEKRRVFCVSRILFLVSRMN